MSSLISRFTAALFSRKPPCEHYQQILRNVENGKIQGQRAIIFAMLNNVETRKWADFTIKEFCEKPSLEDPHNLKIFLEKLPYNKDATNYPKLTEALKEAERASRIDKMSP